MSDMRLYCPTGVYDGVEKSSEEMGRVLPDDPVSNGIEVIAGKVVKFLLTEKGSDAFDPLYGGTSMHYKQISPAFLPQYKLEVGQDVENCLKHMLQADMEYGVEGEKLQNINLLRVAYDPITSPNRVDIYIEIITTLGKRAVVAITPKSGAEQRPKEEPCLS